MPLRSTQRVLPRRLLQFQEPETEAKERMAVTSTFLK